MCYGPFPAHADTIEGFWLAREKDVHRAGEVKRGEEMRTFTLVFISANLPFFFFFLFPPEIQSNHQQADSTLKASSITNHL